ncbi:hypothetical protein FXN63_15310 [Pigmentiphaga aceris]|uniref:Uncharacterized protein n=1 Tax=Pigmentiphaga aceris TaxID=1940612 RepID=A0A5C0AZL9_9BURK|nr:hypothetical protein [Pigmentiphaga aceris]QEI07054.1 hypothetical protein FXN63_15310 [Pigmentiphaga aceris]
MLLMKRFLFVPALMVIALSGTMSAMAAAPIPSVAQILAVCESPSVEEATSKGDTIGWARMSDAQIEPWRKDFLAFNGGSVSPVGWKKSAKPDDDVLSFWIAAGRDSHKACSYLTSSPASLLDQLTAFLGAPQTLEKSALSTTAFWKHGNRETQYSQSGAVGLLNVRYAR